MKLSLRSKPRLHSIAYTHNGQARPRHPHHRMRSFVLDSLTYIYATLRGLGITQCNNTAHLHICTHNIGYYYSGLFIFRQANVKAF